MVENIPILHKEKKIIIVNSNKTEVVKLMK